MPNRHHRPTNITPLIAAALSLLVAGTGCRTSPQPAASARTPQNARTPKVTRLLILSTNDFHGQLRPLTTTAPGGLSLRVGGAEALAATLARLRAQHSGPVLLLDGGDFMQGSLVSAHFEGAPVRELFAQLGYDAVALGNHEFDFGVAGPQMAPDRSGQDPREALKRWARQAPFPVLCANLVLSAGGRRPNWPNLVPSTMVRRGALRIGLVGAIRPGTRNTVMPALLEGIAFRPMAPAVLKQARALRRRGADAVVAVVHATAQCDAGGEGCNGEALSDLLDRLPRGTLDAVVAAHSHRKMAALHDGIPVVQACSRGLAVGRMELDFQGRKVVRRRALPPRLVCHDVFAGTDRCTGTAPAGAQPRLELAPALRKQGSGAARAAATRAAELVDGFRARMPRSMSRRVARLSQAAPHRLHGTSPVGALFAAAMLAQVPGADFAVLNNRSLRSDLPAGQLTMTTLHEVFPFDNRLTTRRLSGRQTQRLLQLLLQNAHGSPQVANLRLTVHCDGGAKRLDRLLDARSGKPLRPGRIYTVVLPDFLATGGGGVAALIETLKNPPTPAAGGGLIRDMVAHFLGAMRQPVDASDQALSRLANGGVTITGHCPVAPSGIDRCR